MEMNISVMRHRLCELKGQIINGCRNILAAVSYTHLDVYKRQDLEVNMFAAANNSLINDGCGLYRGRLILPYEHLSRFQTDLND